MFLPKRLILNNKGDTMNIFKRILNKIIENDQCFKTLKNVEYNKHWKEEIFSNGCYEHKDENGKWVEGPALGHGYEGGYFSEWNPDEFFKNLLNKINKSR